MNLATRFLTCLASSVSTRRCPSRWKEMIGLVQPFWLWMVKLWSSSMLGCLYTSTFKSGGSIPSSNDACFVTLFASEFWLRGTCMKSTWSNSQTNWFVNLRYFCILLSFASYSPFIYPIISLELLLRSMFLSPKALPILNLVSMSSYCASLLMVGNWSRTPYLRVSPLGVLMMTLTPHLF